MNKYTTISGDTWDIIAKKVYGDEHFMHLLIQENFKHRAVAIFSAGIVLGVPDLPVRIDDADVPPWRRAGAGA